MTQLAGYLLASGTQPRFKAQTYNNLVLLWLFRPFTASLWRWDRICSFTSSAEFLFPCLFSFTLEFVWSTHCERFLLSTAGVQSYPPISSNRRLFLVNTHQAPLAPKNFYYHNLSCSSILRGFNWAMEVLYQNMGGIDRQIPTTLLARRVERKSRLDHLLSSYLKRLIMPSFLLYRIMRLGKVQSSKMAYPNSPSPKLIADLLMTPCDATTAGCCFQSAIFSSK